MSSREEIFTNIFRNNMWGSSESVSGTGSTLNATKFLIPKLSKFIREHNINRMVDAPCGDFNWMQCLISEHPDLTYLGCDIVPEIIINNSIKYRNYFQILDIVDEPLPSCDLMLCRDCLGHFQKQDTLRVVENVKKHDIKYFAATHFEDSTNIEITTGNWYPINMREFLGPPLRILNEYREDDTIIKNDKCTAIWKLK